MVNSKQFGRPSAFERSIQDVDRALEMANGNRQVAAFLIGSNERQLRHLINSRDALKHWRRVRGKRLTFRLGSSHGAPVYHESEWGNWVWKFRFDAAISAAGVETVIEMLDELARTRTPRLTSDAAARPEPTASESVAILEDMRPSKKRRPRGRRMKKKKKQT